MCQQFITILNGNSLSHVNDHNKLADYVTPLLTPLALGMYEYVSEFPNVPWWSHDNYTTITLYLVFKDGLVIPANLDIAHFSM